MSRYKEPVFNYGNAAFRRALHQVVEYARQHGVNASGMAGWEETEFGWSPPPTGGAGGEMEFPYHLQKTSTPDTYEIIRPGRIYTNYGDITSTLTITDVDNQFTLDAGDVVYLYMEDFIDPEITLMAGPKWAVWPNTWKWSTEPDPLRVSEAYFLLWECIAGTIPEGEYGVQFSGFYAKRIHRHWDSILIWGAHEKDSDNQHLPVPIIVPL